MMRRLACCRRRTKDFSIDLDEHDRVMTYSGLESCILNSCSYDNESGGSGMSRSEGCAVTDSLDEDCTSCSSSKEALCSSFSSLCLVSRNQEEEHLLDEWETIHNLHLCSKGKVPITYTMRHLDVQTMKERFVKLLLGEDIYGGAKGISASLALSNAIISLSVSVFGELWKLEPLSEDRKNRWRREMDWLLSPTNYMVELVPAKQRGSSGRMLEIMTPKTRSDIHVNRPALQKLDSMLIDVLDSMVETEFWYVEGGSRDDDRSSGIRTSKRWWLPSPMVPEYGLSTIQRKSLCIRAKLVNQVLKAAKSINEQVLLEMPIPEAVTDALPKTGRASLGEEIYRAITAEPYSIEETLLFMNLRSEHAVLEALNRLEGAFLAWKQRISNEETKRSQVRYPWYFAARDGRSDVGRMEVWMERIGMLVRLLKNRFPNLPQTFIEVTKVQYNKDVGHSILEAYSRVIVNLAFSILSRIGDILQEDDLKKPSTPIATLKFDFFSDVYLAGIKETPPGNIRRSLIDQMNNVDGRHFHNTKRGQEAEQWPQGVHQVTEPAPMEA